MIFLTKTYETIWNSPFLRELPPFNQPPISEQFVHDPPLCPNFKIEILPPNMEETMFHDRGVYSQIK